MNTRSVRRGLTLFEVLGVVLGIVAAWFVFGLVRESTGSNLMAFVASCFALIATPYLVMLPVALLAVLLGSIDRTRGRSWPPEIPRDDTPPDAPPGRTPPGAR